MKPLLTCLLVLAYAFHSANAAGVQSELHEEFRAYARRALQDVERLGLADARQLGELREIWEGSEVEPSDLELRPGETVSDRLIECDVPARRLRINENLWRNTGDERVRQAAALHQLQRLLFAEDDEGQELSGAYLKAMGYGGPVTPALLYGGVERLPEISFAPVRIYDLSCERNYRYRDERRPEAPLYAVTKREKGKAIEWYEEPKRFALNLYFGARAPGLVLAQQSLALRSAADSLERVKFSQQARSFVAQEHGAVREQALVYSGQRHFPEPGVAKETGRTEGFSQDTTSTFRQKGAGAFTIESGQLSEGQRQGSWTLVDSNLRCEYRPASGKERTAVGRSLLQAIKGFSELHRHSLERRRVWRACEAREIHSDCSAEETAYRAASAVRDEAWRNLMNPGLLHFLRAKSSVAGAASRK